MEGKLIAGSSIDNKNIRGRVELVYSDALASGTNEYVGVTFLLVRDDEGTMHTVRPRDVTAVYPSIS